MCRCLLLILDIRLMLNLNAGGGGGGLQVTTVAMPTVFNSISTGFLKRSEIYEIMAKNQKQMDTTGFNISD